MKLNKRGNLSLIGLLAAVATIVVLAAMYFGKGGGTATVKNDSTLLDQTSQKQTIIGKSIDTGKSVDCRQRLNQIRAGIATYKASSGTEQNPASFKDLQMGVSADYFTCPVSNQPYIYDPATGTVKCQTHANF